MRISGRACLVGIAGAFMGFHIAVIQGLLPTPLMLYLAALIGALITVWLWSRRSPMTVNSGPVHPLA